MEDHGGVHAVEPDHEQRHDRAADQLRRQAQHRAVQRGEQQRCDHHGIGAAALFPGAQQSAAEQEFLKNSRQHRHLQHHADDARAAFGHGQRRIVRRAARGFHQRQEPHTHQAYQHQRGRRQQRDEQRAGKRQRQHAQRIQPILPAGSVEQHRRAQEQRVVSHIEQHGRRARVQTLDGREQRGGQIQ